MVNRTKRNHNKREKHKRGKMKHKTSKSNLRRTNSRRTNRRRTNRRRINRRRINRRITNNRKKTHRRRTNRSKTNHKNKITSGNVQWGGANLEGRGLQGPTAEVEAAKFDYSSMAHWDHGKVMQWVNVKFSNMLSDAGLPPESLDIIIEIFEEEDMEGEDLKDLTMRLLNKKLGLDENVAKLVLTARDYAEDGEDYIPHREPKVLLAYMTFLPGSNSYQTCYESWKELNKGIDICFVTNNKVNSLFKRFVKTETTDSQQWSEYFSNSSDTKYNVDINPIDEGIYRNCLDLLELLANIKIRHPNNNLPFGAIADLLRIVSLYYLCKSPNVDKSYTHIVIVESDTMCLKDGQILEKCKTVDYLTYLTDDAACIACPTFVDLTGMLTYYSNIYLNRKLLTRPITTHMHEIWESDVNDLALLCTLIGDIETQIPQNEKLESAFGSSVWTYQEDDNIDSNFSWFIINHTLSHLGFSNENFIKFLKISLEVLKRYGMVEENDENRTLETDGDTLYENGEFREATRKYLLIAPSLIPRIPKYKVDYSFNDDVYKHITEAAWREAEVVSIMPTGPGIESSGPITDR